MKNNINNILILFVCLILPCALPAKNVLTTEDQFVAFRHAIEIDNEEEILQLIVNECDVNVQSKRTLWTPLHVVAMKGTSKMADILLNAGAKLDMKDAKGKTPMDYVQRFGRVGDMRDVFEEHIKRSSSISAQDPKSNEEKNRLKM